MKPEPQAEHRWLQKLEGKWSCRGEATMAPGQPPTTWEANEEVRSVNGLWMMAEGRGEMPGGGESTTVMTLGYDPQKRKFVGTFVASVMTHLWVYEGELDTTGRRLTLETEGPGMAGDGAIWKYQDAIEFISDDHRTLTSQVRGEDGTWKEFMTAHYRRKA